MARVIPCNLEGFVLSILYCSRRRRKLDVMERDDSQFIGDLVGKEHKDIQGSSFCVFSIWDKMSLTSLRPKVHGHFQGLLFDFAA